MQKKEQHHKSRAVFFVTIITTLGSDYYYKISLGYIIFVTGDTCFLSLNPSQILFSVPLPFQGSSL